MVWVTVLRPYVCLQFFKHYDPANAFLLFYFPGTYPPVQTCFTNIMFQKDKNNENKQLACLICHRMNPWTGWCRGLFASQILCSVHGGSRSRSATY